MRLKRAYPSSTKSCKVQNPNDEATTLSIGLLPQIPTCIRAQRPHFSSITFSIANARHPACTGRFVMAPGALHKRRPLTTMLFSSSNPDRRKHRKPHRQHQANRRHVSLQTLPSRYHRRPTSEIAPRPCRSSETTWTAGTSSTTSSTTQSTNLLSSQTSLCQKPGTLPTNTA